MLVFERERVPPSRQTGGSFQLLLPSTQLAGVFPGWYVVVILLVIGFECTWSQALTETRPKMGDIDGVGTAAYKVHSRYTRSPKRTCLNQKDTYVHSSTTLAQTHVCMYVQPEKNKLPVAPSANKILSCCCANFRSCSIISASCGSGRIVGKHAPSRKRDGDTYTVGPFELICLYFLSTQLCTGKSFGRQHGSLSFPRCFPWSSTSIPRYRGRRRSLTLPPRRQP